MDPTAASLKLAGKWLSLFVVVGQLEPLDFPVVIVVLLFVLLIVVLVVVVVVLVVVIVLVVVVVLLSVVVVIVEHSYLDFLKSSKTGLLLCSHVHCQVQLQLVGYCLATALPSSK